MGYPTYVERTDMAEQRPDEWIDAIAKSWKKVREERTDIRIDAVVLTAQMPTLVELDADNQVIGRAVTWQDSRSDELVGELLSVDERRRLYKIACTPIDGRYLIPMYLRRRRDGVPEPSVVLSAKDYLYFALTGQKITDPSTASGFGNYDLENQQFSNDLNALWDFDSGLLPRVAPSNTSHPLAKSGAEILSGLIKGRTPVVLGSADSVAAFHFTERVFGAAVAIIDGSSTVILGRIREGKAPHFDALVTPLVDGARSGLEMDLLATGSSISWLARLFGRASGDMETLALSAGSRTVNPVLFEPYLAGGEQGALWRTDLSGVISNLHLGSTQSDIALALFEGIAFEVIRCLDVMAPFVETPTVVWLMGANYAGLLPALLSALAPYLVVCVPGRSPSLLGAALIALEVLPEKHVLTDQKHDLSSSPFVLDDEYVAALRTKQVSYLAKQATST